MALRWSLLLALTPLLAAEEMEKDVTGYNENHHHAGCPKPEWDSSLRFVPEKTSYDDEEELTLSCLTEDDPPLAVITCAAWTDWEYAWVVKDKEGTWHHIEMYQACTGTCQKPQWDKRVVLVPRKGTYTLNEELRLSCPGDVKPSFTNAKCVREFQGMTLGKPVYGVSWWGRSGTGAWTRIEEPVACVVKCSRPPWDPDLHLAPERDVYEEGEEVTLSCPEGSLLPFQQAKCAWRPRAVATGEHKGTWAQKNKWGQWVPIQSPTKCIRTCQKPWWDPRLRLAPDQEEYHRNEEVALSCPEGFQPPFTHVRCAGEVQTSEHSGFSDRATWLGRKCTGVWIHIEGPVVCLVSGQPPGPWPWTAVTVVAVLSAMVMLSAGILGFVMCRRRKALPRKAEEDHYTELQPYENSDHYCVIKERFLAEEEAGRGGRAGERPSLSLRRTLGDHSGCQRAETAGRTTPA